MYRACFCQYNLLQSVAYAIIDSIGRLDLQVINCVITLPVDRFALANFRYWTKTLNNYWTGCDLAELVCLVENVLACHVIVIMVYQLLCPLLTCDVYRAHLTPLCLLIPQKTVFKWSSLLMKSLFSEILLTVLITLLCAVCGGGMLFADVLSCCVS